LEKSAATAVYPCKYRQAGCEETFTVEDRNKHLSVCLYQGSKCPLNIVSDLNCIWNGTPSDIEAHIEYKHASEVSIVPEFLLMVLYKFARGMRYSKLVFTLGELFYLICKVEGDAFSFGVFHIGNKEETEAFRFSIKMGGSKENILVTRKCHSYLESGLKDLHPGKSVKIYYDTILDFVGESGHLVCKIEIGRETLDGFLSENAGKCSHYLRVYGSAIDL
jgi:hypothetical protein